MKQISLIAIASVALATSAFAAPATMRVDYYHTGNDKRRALQPRSRRHRAAAVAGQPVAGRSTTRTSASISSRSSTPPAARSLYSRGFALDLRRMGDDRRSAEDEPHVLRVAAISRPSTSPARDRRSRSATRSNAFQEIWTLDDRSRRTSSSCSGSGTPTPAPLIKLHEARRSGDEARPADSRRRLHRGRARQVRARRAAADGRALRHVAVQGAQSATSTSGDSCPPAAQSGISRPSTGYLSRARRSAPRYDAFDSERYMLTFENQALPRHRRERARTNSSRS